MNQYLNQHPSMDDVGAELLATIIFYIHNYMAQKQEPIEAFIPWKKTNKGLDDFGIPLPGSEEEKIQAAKEVTAMANAMLNPDK